MVKVFQILFMTADSSVIEEPKPGEKYWIGVKTS